jgi:hypothetical protein
VEGVTESDEPCAFVGSIDVQHPGQAFWLIGNHSDGIAIQMHQSNHQVGCIFTLNFQEFRIIGNIFNYLQHIIRLLRVFRDQIGNFHSKATWIITTGTPGWGGEVIGR